MKITKLPESVINRIAAGEVVERPYSVVRELVDNALDARARSIVVELEAGGHDRIVVRDDGCGMSPEDACQAFERHATSKISEADDLDQLTTYGFRGEALAAIASVSRIELRTRTTDSSLGTELQLEAGELKSDEQVPCAVGTTITISQLFFNTPARRKFMGSERGELIRVKRWLSDISLANPEVSFELKADGKRKLKLAARPTFIERAKELFGAGGVQLDSIRESLSVAGLLLHPEMAKSSAQALTVLVNSRVIMDRGLVHAAKQGFGGMLKPKQYPSGVISITMPPELVDVNVHPQKLEVRFWNSSRMFQFLYHAVRDAVQDFGGGIVVSSSASSDETPASTLPQQQTPQHDPQHNPQRFQFDRPLGEQAIREVIEPVSSPIARGSQETASPLPFRFADLRYLGTVMSCYLICEYEESLIVVDMHAAHERINYNLIASKLEKGSIKTEQLLVPLTLRFDDEESVAELLDQQALLSESGFVVESLDATSVAIKGKPSWISIGKVSDALKDIAAADGIRSLPETAIRQRREEVAARLACHASIRSGDIISREEVYALFEAMDDAEGKGLCPHGRPVIKQFSKEELEKLFGRIQ